MAYNSNKGPQHSGDIQYEGDPNDVQIDFENDQIILRTGGAPRVNVTNSEISGSGVFRMAGAISGSGDMAITGAIHAASFHGDGSNLTGVSAVAASGSARHYSTTGFETSGYLKVSGSSTLNAATLTTLSGSGLAQLTSITASADLVASGSVIVGENKYIGIPGRNMIEVKDGSIVVMGLLRADNAVSSSSLILGTSLTSSGDCAVTGNVHATAYYGDGSNLTGVSAVAASGSARHYSTTGFETSGYLKVSGSSTLNGVTATTYSGSSTMQVVGATILGGNLNVSGSTVMEGLTVNGITNVGGYSGSNTLQNVGNAFFGGTVNASGSIKLQVNEPAIYFSNSAGNVLGEMGFNSSNNILIQNNFTNKHIVFKANDSGTLREGFRIDGAVPEVVVNQGSDSLLDFRVESDSNAHMLFVDGSKNSVGINSSTPSHTLEVTGSYLLSGSARASYTIRLTAGAYAVSETDNVILFNNGSTSTATLPAINDSNKGIQFYIKNVGAGTVTLTGSADAEQFIDGQQTLALSQGDCAKVMGIALLTGYDWLVLSYYNV
jgi:hypothetical protein